MIGGDTGAWSCAAQPAHAADRLPRRVPSISALVLRLWAEYTCRQSCPASGVAVKLSLLGCRVVGRKTPAADAPAVGRQTEARFLTILN